MAFCPWQQWNNPCCVYPRGFSQPLHPGVPCPCDSSPADTEERHPAGSGLWPSPSLRAEVRNQLCVHENWGLSPWVGGWGSSQVTTGRRYQDDLQPPQAWLPLDAKRHCQAQALRLEPAGTDDCPRSLGQETTKAAVSRVTCAGSMRSRVTGVSAKGGAYPGPSGMS